MKHLLLAAITCFTYENITNCNNGVSLIDFGNMTHITMPNQSTMTLYNYENGSTVILPKNPVPTFYPHLQKFDTPLLTPALSSPVLD